MAIKNKMGTDDSSLNSKYFFINSALNAQQYYVWFNVENTGVDPQINGKTGLRVDIAKGSNSEIVCQSTKSTLDSTGKFLTNISSDTLIITNVNVGQTSVASDVSVDFLIFTQKLGENRELLAILNMEYDSQNNIISVERV
jgi:hypothetical protein